MFNAIRFEEWVFLVRGIDGSLSLVAPLILLTGCADYEHLDWLRYGAVCSHYVSRTSDLGPVFL